MVTVWRLAPPEFVRSLDGAGSALVGGRWNSPGRRVVYTSAHLSLSVLEVLVHIPAAMRDRLPEFEAVRIGVPDDGGTTDVSIARFEELMNSEHPLAACRSVGDAWCEKGVDLMLQAPSVLVPEDLNIMINSEHPLARELSILSTRPFRFDSRLVVPHG